MARLLVMYKTPHDTTAFDQHYFENHIPLAKRIPGVRKFEVSEGAITSPMGSSGYHLVAMLQFDDLAAIQNALFSEEGQAAVADVQGFATGGVDVLMFDSRDA